MLDLENPDDTSFSELMRKSLSEIPQLCPEWTDFNAHDPGITFLEMLMWLTEMQRYYLSQITDKHLESYLRILGTNAGAAVPTVISVFFSSDETVLLKRDSIFYIGDIPFRPTEDTLIAPGVPESILREGGGYIIKQNIGMFKGGIMPLYFSSDGETDKNPMRDGFYPRAEVKAFLVSQRGTAACPVKDGTYGLYQSGFIRISIPKEFDEKTAVLRLELISDDNFELPSESRFRFDIRELVQLDKDGNTLGADGRVKENVCFSADIEGKRVAATVYGEIVSGKAPESPRDAFKRFKEEREHPPRAVAAKDYERIALETPGLCAELVNVFSKETGKVSVCVKTVGDSPRGNEIKNLRKALFEAKPVGMEIEILTPVIFSARLTVEAKTDGGTGGKKLAEHIENVFEPLKKRMGALIDMPELFKRIGSSPVVSEMRSMRLRLGKGAELAEKDVMKLPDDGLLRLVEIIIQ